MIKQQILLNNVEILRLYHQGFDDYPTNRRIQQKEDVKGEEIEFIETWIAELEGEIISYDNIMSGFLPSNHTKNPYGTLCCEFQEFISYEKLLIQDGRIENPTQFGEICDFIKKWSGFDLKKSPFSVNNILLFSPTDIQISTKKNHENDRVLDLLLSKNGYGDLTGIFKFKQYQSIVDTKLLPIVGKTISAESEKDWTNVDMELFANGQLVYAHYDLSFVRAIHFNMGIITKQVDVALKQVNKTVTLEQVSTEPVKVGKSEGSQELVTYQYQEQLLKRQLNAEKRFEFLTKGEYERALEIFADIANERSYKEMFVFDPYFISYESGGKSRLHDILTVLGKNLNVKKKIIFEVDPQNFQTKFEQFKAAIQDTLTALKRKGIQLDFSFMGTNEHFHDRFIFLKNEYQLKAFILGTSFNSFGDNYSTIVELERLDGQRIYETLMKDVASPEHLLLHEDII